MSTHRPVCVRASSRGEECRRTRLHSFFLLIQPLNAATEEERIAISDHGSAGATQRRVTRPEDPLEADRRRTRRTTFHSLPATGAGHREVAAGDWRRLPC